MNAKAVDISYCSLNADEFNTHVEMPRKYGTKVTREGTNQVKVKNQCFLHKY